MTTLGKLSIAITATTKGLETALSKSKSLLGGLTKGIALPAILGGAGAGAAAMQLAKIGDSWALMGKQLEYITGNSYDAQRAQDRLYEISRETGTAMEDNALTFVKLSQASKMTGLTMDENLDTIETLNKIMILTGTSGIQASQALMQLSQGLTSGKLAGDEFRTMGEAAPGLLQAIADAAGIAREDLKKMSADGLITSELLGKAFVTLNQQGTTAFGELPQTVSRGMNAVNLAFQRTWDYINDNTGIIGMVEDALFDLANYIEANAYEIGKWVQEGWTEFVSVAPQILDNIQKIAQAMGWLAEKLLVVIDGWQRWAAWIGVANAQNDLFKQQTYTEQQIRDYEAETGETVDRSTIFGKQASPTVINNFNQKISRSDALTLTSEQVLQAVRA